MFAFSPYPPTYRSAVTFVDDTDGSTRDNIEPVYLFLAERGFWGTKTVWPLRARRTSAFTRRAERSVSDDGTGSTLEDPVYADFIRRLAGMGFEIALHGTAAGNSRRSEIEAGLARFRLVVGKSPALNTFHSRNLENLYCGPSKLDSPFFRMLERVVDGSEYEGDRRDTDSFWADIVRDTFRFVRLPFHTIDEIDTLKVNPSMPFRDPSRPFVRRWFASSDGSNVFKFTRLLACRNVEKLVRERGACIVYTHFAKGFAHPRPDGYVLDAAFTATVDALTRRDDIWFPTATQLLERLEATQQLSLLHDGARLEVRNLNVFAIEPVLRVPPGVWIAADGHTLETHAELAVLPRLQPWQRLELTTNCAGRHAIGPPALTISRSERRRIEFLNYFGLVRNCARDRLPRRLDSARR